MKRTAVLMSFLLAVVVCTSGAAAATYKPEYKLSLVSQPTTPWGKAAVKFSDIVREKTSGKINIKVYFNGQLFAGMQTNEFLILRQGVADFAVGSTINWSPTLKELNLFSLPFFFPNYKSLDAVKAGEPGKKMFKLIEDRGVIGLGWGENGYRELTNAKRPVRTPEDLDGLKIRVVGSPIFIDIFRALGANPISINWAEAVTAFQQGVVDGQENPISSIIIPNKLWEFHKYITVWHYTIDPLILGVSKVTWDTFDQKDKEIIRAAATEAMAWDIQEARKGLEGNMDALGVLKSHNMDVVVLSPKEMEPFKAKTKSVYEKWNNEIGGDLIKSAEKNVADSLK
jgi:tripartite ATP-independent transporter DctP family solute receptor